MDSCQGYVFSEEKRIFVKWILPVLSLVSCCLSAFFTGSAAAHSENRGACIFAAVFFVLLGVFLILGRRNAVKLYSLRYICGNDTLQNIGEMQDAFVDTRLPLFVSQTRIEGSARIPWSECFYILSNKPLSFAVNYENNGMRVVRELMRNGAVILPVTDATQRGVEQLLGKREIPVYPRAAYFR